MGGEQLQWPLSCPFHLFGNIISTNQGRAKGKWSDLIYTFSPLPGNRETGRNKTVREGLGKRERGRVACKTGKKKRQVWKIKGVGRISSRALIIADI